MTGSIQTIGYGAEDMGQIKVIDGKGRSFINFEREDEE